MPKVDERDIKQRAIKLAGGRQALADALGITPQAITQWTHIPAERLGDVSRATKGQMSPEQLRPDIFAGLPTRAA
nr:Cro/CI family transcriptional regulator [uncultured Halomonas sp.]